MSDPPESTNHSRPALPPQDTQDVADYNEYWANVLPTGSWQRIEGQPVVRDTDENRDTYTPYEDAIYWATDTRQVYIGTGSAWNAQDSTFWTVITNVANFTSNNWYLTADDGGLKIGDRQSGTEFSFKSGGGTSFASAGSVQYGQYVYGGVGSGIQATVTPGEDGPAQIPPGTYSAFITANGSNVVDLSEVAAAGRRVTIWHDGGSNTPRIEFDGADFIGDGPPAITSRGASVLVEYHDGSWYHR